MQAFFLAKFSRVVNISLKKTTSERSSRSELMPRKLLTKSWAEVRLDRLSRKALAFRAGTSAGRLAKVSFSQKEIGINQRTLVFAFYSCFIYNIKQEETRMTNVEKKKVMLSLPVETNTKLEELARENGLSKSALVTVLIQKLKQEGQIFK